MAFVGETGDTIETRGKMTVEWKVCDFFALSDKVGDVYQSPGFSFAGSRWCLRLYPNGDTDKSSEWVSLFLRRKDSCPPKTVQYTFRLKGYDDNYEDGDGKEKKSETHKSNFLKKDNGFGSPQLWSRHELRNDMSKLMPNNILTIICDLKCCQPKATKVSWGSRVCEISSSMKEILDRGERSDFTLKLGDREWPVHKMILESRCEYFANMFRHDWVENTVGLVKFDDLQEDVLDSVLHFVYTGDVEDMSVENVCPIYVAAHKFLLDNLKVLCVEYMKGNMCVEIVCEALVIAGTYEEKDLNDSAIEYFIREDDRIFDREEWKELKKNHLSIAAELLEETTKREKKKRSKE